MAKEKTNKTPAAILNVTPTKGDKVFDVINIIIMVLLCIIIVYPLYYVVLASITDPKFTFTLFFNGGIIPMFLTIKSLGIYNTPWALVLPAAVSVYNLIVCRSFFESSLPQDLLEAAQIDGCTDFRFFFQFAIPLSKTIIAVMLLYYATAMWNTFFNALMFLQDEKRMPLQVVLRNLVLSNQLSASASGAEAAEKQKLVDQLKYVIITVSAVPLMIVYPFVQKYFASGVMLGAVKG